MQNLGSVVVVGGGLTGARAVQKLRDEGYSGKLTVVGAEEHLPYERPPLSKGYLQGADERDSVFVKPQAWYDEQDVELLLGARAEQLDPASRRLVLGDGRELAWDALLLATGSRPRMLNLPGTDLDGVLTLRTLDDSDRLKATLSRIRRLVIVGGGWIGLEVAAAARAADVAVTVLEHAELPLLAVLGREVATVFADLHRAHDVDLRVGVDVAAIVGRDGAVTGVALGDGEVVPADAVLVAVGASPRTELAKSAGLDVRSGVVVDAGLRSSAPGIFAAGDIAEAYHPILRDHIRVEHWDNAREQGFAAARSMLGQDVSYERLPYFYTDQYDLGMEYTGYLKPGGYDDVVLRGDVPGLKFVVLWLAAGRVVAGMGVNVWDAMDPVRELVASGRTVDPGRVRDVDVALTDL